MQQSSKAGRNTGPAWEIRPYQTGDEVQLLTLYERCYGRPRSMDNWRWKFRIDHTDYPLVWVAELPDSGRIVGHYGAIPFDLRIGGESCSSMQTVEAMTDPDFRRQGMLTRFGEVCYAAWKDSGVRIVTGMPNEQWGSSKQAHGWVPHFPLAWLRFPSRPELLLSGNPPISRVVAPIVGITLRAAGRLWLASARLRSNSHSAIVRLESAQDGSAFSRIWAYAGPTWNTALIRNEDWVTWRYLRAKPQHYQVMVAWRGGQPVGYISFQLNNSNIRPKGLIADVFFARGEPNVARQLILGVLNEFRSAGASLVLTLAVPGSVLHAVFKSLNFLSTPKEMAFSFETVTLDPSVPHRRISDPSAWQLAGGDLDVM